MGFIKKLIGVFFVFMTLAGIVTMTSTSTTTNNDITYDFIATIFCVLIAFLCLKSSTNKKVDAYSTTHNTKKRVYYFNHTSGLTAPQNTMSAIKIHDNNIEIECNGVEYNLSNEKITDISTKTDTEITNHFSSSTGGAIAGALMFGAVGAAIGGRNKKKKTAVSKSYLVITYLKGNDIDYIVFDATNSFMDAIKFIKEFDNYKVDNIIQVEL